ncbi:MAG: nicotinate-nucleotide adenylyltransferase [Lachnospiraceae bacterium]|jgi:nicotinate-nucleotide adenylyltransferase|nr:nicotinate-nucleotide adenylyltransferase [Lachnospiraceae bacterium]
MEIIMGKKVGIMGGTFNPVHNGHLILAENAREAFSLDEILFIPSGNSYMKDTSSILAGGVRARMIELALEGNPYFSLSWIDLKREGPTYTCDTLAQLKERNPEDQYYFIMGADNLLTMESWKNPGFILENCMIIAAVRGNGTESRIERAAGYLQEKYNAHISILPARYIDISSSEIRQRLKEHKSVRYMLPGNVLRYIDEKGLYREVSG